MTTLTFPGTIFGAVIIVGLAAAAARWLRWLTPGGAIAAWAVGAAVLGFGGVVWATVLAAFFATGTLLTRAGRERKTQPEHAGRGRDAAQVLCTGGVAAVVATVWGLGLAPPEWRGLFYPAFLGSLAAATADTWATEVGMLSRRPPRLITSLRVVPAGTSGGVTVLGLTAGLAGAAVIAVLGAWSLPVPGAWAVIVAVTLSGTAAMLVDSLLGATLQATFRRADGRTSEEPEAGAARARGIPWLTNPVVNLVATAGGALAAAALVAWFSAGTP
jgi:uncharacterized protein (TIGR00297 family)